MSNKLPCVMYSQNFKYLIGNSLRVANALGASPLLFIQKTATVEICPNQYKLIRNWRLAVAWQVLSFGLVCKYWRNSDNDTFHLTLSWWIGTLCLLLIYSISRFFSNEIANACNALTKLIYSIKGMSVKFLNWLPFCFNLQCFNLDSYMPNFKPNQPHGVFLMVEIAMATSCLVCVTSCISAISYLCYDPGGVIFFGGFIPRAYLKSWISFLIICFHSYMIAVYFSGVSALGAMIIGYMFYLYLLISRELRMGTNVKYLCDSSFRISQNVRLVYRAIQVLGQHLLLTCSCGLYILGCNALFIKTSIYLTFVLLRYWSELKLITKVPMLIGDILAVGWWTFVLELGCLYFVAGKRTLMSWNRHNWGFQEQNRLMRKFQRSSKPILLCYGTQFVIGPLSVLRFYRCVIRGTFRVLLATK